MIASATTTSLAAAASSSAAVLPQNLRKQFGQETVFNNLGRAVPRNSIFGFLGPNGAGKSTRSKLLLGLIPPTSGSVEVFGYAIRRDAVAIRSKVGYLAQDPRYYDHMTARQMRHYSAGFFFRGAARRIKERVAENSESGIPAEQLAATQLQPMAGRGWTAR